MSRKRRKRSPLVQTSAYSHQLACRFRLPYWERLSQGAAVFMLAVFPLVIGFFRYQNITEVKFQVFRFATLAYLVGALLLCLTLLNRRNRAQRCSEGIQRPDALQLLRLAFVLWGVVCALVAPYQGLWLGQSRYEGVQSMLLYSVLFLLLSFWGEYTDYLLPAVSVMAVAEGVICMMQLFGSRILYPLGRSYVDTIFLGTIGHFDMLAGLICMAAPMLLCGFVFLDTKWRWVMLAGGTVLFAVELYTDVDSGKMGLMAALLVALPFLLSERRSIVRTLYTGAVLLAAAAFCRLVSIPTPERSYVLLTPDRGVAGLLVLAAAAGAGAYLLGRRDKPLPVQPETLRRMVAVAEAAAVVAAVIFLLGYNGGHPLLSEIHQALHGNLADGAGNNRGFVWKRCVQLMAQSPVFGYGPGSFSEVFAPYNREELGYVFDCAHNDFLHIGVGMGYVGLGLYLAFVVMLAVRYLRYAPKCPLIVICGCAVAGYLAHSFFSFSMAIVTPVFWAMAGLLDKWCRQLRVQAEREETAHRG